MLVGDTNVSLSNAKENLPVIPVLGFGFTRVFDMVVACSICCLNFRDFNCSIVSSALLYIGGIDVSAKSALILALP